MKKPEREWNDPPMPDDSPISVRKITGYFSTRGIIISLCFIWSIWGIAMIREWVIWDDVTPFILVVTFIPLTVYAILISPIVEWSWNAMAGRKP